MLTKKTNDLEKQFGPEYLALVDALNNADQSSKDFQDILSMFANCNAELFTRLLVPAALVAY